MSRKNQTNAEVIKTLKSLIEAVEQGHSFKLKVNRPNNGHNKVHSKRELPKPYPKLVEQMLPFWEGHDWPRKCVEWQGRKHYTGYGVATFDPRGKNRVEIQSHRLAYLFGKGDIPSNMVVNHTCNNKSCCNPEHLEVLTRSHNATLGLMRHHGI